MNDSSHGPILFDNLIGLTPKEVVNILQPHGWIVVLPGAISTRELRDDRVSLRVGKDGKVTSIHIG